MNKLLFITFLFLLCGCTTTKMTCSQQTWNIVDPPTPKPVTIQSFDVKVYNREDVENYLKTNKDNFGWFVMEPESAEKLYINLIDINRYIKQLKQQTAYYQNFIKNKNEQILKK